MNVAEEKDCKLRSLGIVVAESANVQTYGVADWDGSSLPTSAPNGFVLQFSMGDLMAFSFYC